MTLLDVRGLTVTTDEDRTLVDDLTFAVGAGERLGLIGESGSGKSLTSLAVLGLLPPGMTATGSVRLAGTEVVGAREKALTELRGRRASVVFQEPLTALDPLMRVGRQIAEPLRRRTGLKGDALRKAVADALDQVRLPDPRRIARAFPHEISGGQRQRVALAMALACEPELLIADEPTTALDVTVQADMLDLLDSLVRERSMALLFVSHDIAVRLPDHGQCPRPPPRPRRRDGHRRGPGAPAARAVHGGPRGKRPEAGVGAGRGGRGMRAGRRGAGAGAAGLRRCVGWCAGRRGAPRTSRATCGNAYTGGALHRPVRGAGAPRRVRRPAPASRRAPPAETHASTERPCRPVRPRPAAPARQTPAPPPRALRPAPRPPAPSHPHRSPR